MSQLSQLSQLSQFPQFPQFSQFSQFSAESDEEIRPGVVLTHSARSGSNGTVCHAVSMSSKCWHLCAALQVFVTTTALSAELCWMSCKCSHHRTAPDVLQVLASFLLCSPQVFLTTTAPCAALCWMSCKCSHLREAPDLFVKGKHPMPNVSEPLRAECVRTTPYIHKQKCFVFA